MTTTTTKPSSTITETGTSNRSSDQRHTQGNTNGNNNSNISNGNNNNNNKGNLHSLLKAYDLNHDNTALGIDTTNNVGVGGGGGSSDSISLQLDQIGRERSSTLGSIRERGLTFGSEFDLGLGLGLGLGLTNDIGSGTCSVSEDAVFDLSVVNGQKVNIVSAGNSKASDLQIQGQGQGHQGGQGQGLGQGHIQGQELDQGQVQGQELDQGQVQGQGQSGISSLISGFAAQNTSQTGTQQQSSTTTNQGQNQGQGQVLGTGLSMNTMNMNLNTGMHDYNSQTSVGSGFLNKMFSNNNNNNNGNTNHNGMGQGIVQNQGNTQFHGLHEHTPPTSQATSYEAKHFGKRVRSGSISGRLRSMSDLEDRGLIDSSQKGILKDLIISGDDELMVAVEKYERGDTKALETMIKSGALRTRHASDIDILGDLDLDFLSMNEDFAGDDSVASNGGVGVGINNGGVSAGGGIGNGLGNGVGGVGTGNATMSIPGQGHTSRPLPIPTRSRRRSLSDNSNTFLHHSHSNHDSDASNSMRDTSPAPGHAYDGIVDLDFNADYANAAPPGPATRSASGSISSGGNTDVNMHTNNEAAKAQTGKSRADFIFDIQRNRANSLAFGSLLDEVPSGEVESVGKWMDLTPTVPEASRKMPLKKRVSSQIVGANGGLYIINNPTASAQQQQQQSQQQQQQQKPINTAKLEKLDAAEMKRREREAKKALKEREKQERKLQREREKLEKKERNANEKKSGRKNKKGESARRKKADMDDDGDNDEPKVVVSGTGRPRSLSDPNLTIGLDANGLMQIEHPPDWVGAYSPQSRKIRIERFLAKRNHRVWVKKVKYDVRKNFADSRLRVKGRFVKKEDELLMRDLMSLT